MSLTQSPISKPGVSQAAFSHMHVSSEACPTCDQPIPHDRFDEIKARIQVRQQARVTELTARLREDFSREKTDAVEQVRLESVAAIEREKQQAAEQITSARDEERRLAQAMIDKVQQDAAANEAAIREQARQSADLAAQEKIAEAERISREAQEALTARIEQAETARLAAEQAGTSLQTQLEETRRNNEAAIEKLKQEAAANEVAIRVQAQEGAEAASREKIAELQHAQQESEQALQARIQDAENQKVAAEEATQLLLAQLDQVRDEGNSAIEKLKQETETRISAERQEAAAALEKANADAAIREAAARADASRAAEVALQERISQAEQAKTAAETKAASAEETARTLKETHDSEITARVGEVRTAMEAARVQAVNAAKAEAYEEKLKLSERLEEVQRAFDKKTAEEQGEGAEVNLFESLKEMFDGDKIERVGRGNAGADIIHTVMHNGMECGKIIYDSKDHNQWRYDFATKLASDKIAAKADHAILSVRKFPQGTRQLHVHDGVIVANPARVVALVQVVREHILKTHTLRLSNEAKLQKSAELYAFVTSAQFTDLLNRVDTQAQELQTLQDDERKAHESLWKKQSIRFRSIQKTGADLSNRIDIILGTAEAGDKAVNDE